MFVGFWNPSGITELVGGQCMDDTMKHTRFSKVFGIAMERWTESYTRLKRVYEVLEP
jgi:hypothetical protein